MNSRQSILRGQKPNASHAGALLQADATLRNVCQLPPQNAAPLGVIITHSSRQILTDPATGNPGHHRHLRREHTSIPRRRPWQVAQRGPFTGTYPTHPYVPTVSEQNNSLRRLSHNISRDTMRVIDPPDRAPCTIVSLALINL
jgi:hypothetical protein